MTRDEQCRSEQPVLCADELYISCRIRVKELNMHTEKFTAENLDAILPPIYISCVSQGQGGFFLH